jgi:polar amino acid transport system permease protein
MIREFTFNEILFILTGLGATFGLSALAFVCGIGGGLAVALCRTSQFRPMRALTSLYIDVFRGTPLLMQLFVAYFALALLGFELNAWSAAALCFTLHASAFLGEIWRGSIEAVPRGQVEAARALSLGYFSRMRYVVLPQAFKISLPATVGFLVQLIKGTSLASIIGFHELTRAGTIVSNGTYRPLLAYGVVAVVYFALCWPLSLWSARLERQLSARN